MGYLRGITAPYAPPSYNPSDRTQHILHGWDGSTWDLSDGRTGVYLIRDGVEGLGMPDIENYTFSSPVVHGVEWEGWRALPRDTHWTIAIFEDSAVEWLDLKKRFWNIFRPGQEILWEIILPTNNHYFLKVRFKKEPGVYHRDPVRLGWAIYGITCFAEQPFWEGPTLSQRWDPGTNDDFFNGGVGGPPFIISATSTIDTAQITNPGDVESYMRWILRGPFTSATVGYGSYTTTVTNVLAGEIVELNTDPTQLTATKDGVDIMPSLGSFDFVAIPPGQDINLSLSMVGSGIIEAFFTPRYLRGI